MGITRKSREANDEEGTTRSDSYHITITTRRRLTRTPNEAGIKSHYSGEGAKLILPKR